MNKIQGCVALYLLIAGLASGAETEPMEGWLLPVEATGAAGAPGSASGPAESVLNREIPAGTETGSAPLDLVSLLESALIDKLGLPGRVELIPTGLLPAVSDDGEPVDVVLIENPQRLSGSGVVLRYEILKAGESAGEWRGVFRCRHLAEVWVPTRRLDPGEPMLPSDFEAREVDLVRNAKSVVADQEQFYRYELARSVYPGRPISWSDLTPRSLVRKGELVDVVVRDGILSISMKALAVNTGSLGDVVAVRNLESKREFPAEVIDEKTVQVSF
ncbi:MAG: flagellar basal body P-ring formation chaperone FlgA [Opitutaceae bacterium]